MKIENFEIKKKNSRNLKKKPSKSEVVMLEDNFTFQLK